MLTVHADGLLDDWRSGPWTIYAQAVMGQCGRQLLMQLKASVDQRANVVCRSGMFVQQTFQIYFCVPALHPLPSQEAYRKRLVQSSLRQEARFELQGTRCTCMTVRP
jgi:hypothetical protein